MKPESMDAVFQALAHVSRRKILDVVSHNPGCSVNDVCQYFTTSRIATMKHLRVLEEAGLIVSTKVGRSRQLRFNVVPIQLIYDRWATEYSGFWASQVTDLKFRAEDRAAGERRRAKSRRSARASGRTAGRRTKRKPRGDRDST